MKDKAGQMGAGAAWGIAIGASILGGIVAWVIPGAGLTWLLSLVIYGVAGWAAVYLTQASAGKGILAFLVGGIVSGVIAYFAIKSAVSSAVGSASGELSKSMGELAKAGSAASRAQLDAQMAQASAAMSSGFGAMAGVIAFVVSLIRTFLIGMIGCFIGSSMKKSAIGGGTIQAKAA